MREILARRGAPVDAARGARRDELGDAPTTRQLVASLVLPYTELLGDEAGRSYVRIVVQLRGRFAAWRVASDAATTKHLKRILDELESRGAARAEVRRERVVGLIMLLTASVAERARRIDDGAANELDDEGYAENLIDMCTAVLGA